jgi:hypothetical protein
VVTLKGLICAFFTGVRIPSGSLNTVCEFGNHQVRDRLGHPQILEAGRRAVIEIGGGLSSN